MNDKVLVAYASKCGSTGEVAEAIAKELVARGKAVDVRLAQNVSDLNGYQAVIVGSAIRMGQWLPEAVKFVKTNQQVLGYVPVALFCVHIQNRGDDETSRQNRLAYLDAVRPLLQPVDEAFFAGRFDRHGAALMLPGWLARIVPTFDLRDWKKIRAWADSIRPLLLQ